MVFLFLAILISVSAFTISPPASPFAGTSTASGSFSLGPPSGPFTNTATAGTGTSGGTGSTGTSGTGSTGSTGTSGGSTGGSSGSGRGGGGGSGLIRIDLSKDPVVRMIPLGRSIQFSKNNRYYPSLLVLRRIDSRNGMSNWAIEAKFYDVAKSASQLWDLDRDKKPDVVIQVISIDRNSVTISAKIPSAQTSAPQVPRTAPPVRAPETEPAPEYEPTIPEPPSEPEQEFYPEPEIAEENLAPLFPIKKLAIGAGFLLAAVIVMFAIKGLKKSHDIQEYIEEGLKTGHSEEEIRVRLSAAGWGTEEIDKAMEAVEGKNI